MKGYRIFTLASLLVLGLSLSAQTQKQQTSTATTTTATHAVGRQHPDQADNGTGNSAAEIQKYNSDLDSRSHSYRNNPYWRSKDWNYMSDNASGGN